MYIKLNSLNFSQSTPSYQEKWTETISKLPKKLDLQQNSVCFEHLSYSRPGTTAGTHNSDI